MADKDQNQEHSRYDTQKLSTTEVRKLLTSRKPGAREVILRVFEALEEKGYNPVNQLTGYILSGDPTYITGHNNARSLIGQMERDELLETIIAVYLRGQKL
jgi:uncharacterized protein (UPF0297 family)